MISYIKGIISYINESYIIVENNGIGYNIQVSQNTRSRLSIDSEKIIKIYTYMNVKDDGISLFGFLSMDELEIFNKIISVSGIGPKGALSILSVMTPNDIVLAVITEDINAFSKGQGIGKKTAQRIVLELKDKVDSFGYTNKSSIDSSITASSINNMDSEKQDAINGLLALGFEKSQTVKAVMESEGENLTSAEIIKSALKKLSSK